MASAELDPSDLQDLEQELEDAARSIVPSDPITMRAHRYAPGSGPQPASAVIEVKSTETGDIAEAFIDEAYQEFVGRQNNLVSGAIQQSHDALQKYGSTHEYDVDSIIDSFAGVDVDRTPQTITIRYGWDHPAAIYYDRGTSDHTVNGKPLLVFVWEERHNPPQWVREEFEREGDGWLAFLPQTEPSGIPEGRFIHAGLEWLRREVQ